MGSRTAPASSRIRDSYAAVSASRWAAVRAWAPCSRLCSTCGCRGRAADRAQPRGSELGDRFAGAADAGGERRLGIEGDIVLDDCCVPAADLLGEDTTTS
ncbi:hypothetical protein [Streptomyces capitiformicae]|uniref:hypothetical protein n=1 Tax=Streptomyces capitiformicae TaxID=2014920 RepID=UPI001676FA5A|nr:hypothetical protein [Streptomyces capitiformicae]